MYLALSKKFLPPFYCQSSSYRVYKNFEINNFLHSILLYLTPNRAPKKV